MKRLARKIGRLGENHVEKMVLGIAGAICMWLFFTRVVFSPNVVTIDDTGKAYTPGEIDHRIYEEKAQTLRAELLRQKEAEPTEKYVRRFNGVIAPEDPAIAGIINRPLPNGFVGLFERPLSFLDAMPGRMPRMSAPDRRFASRKYHLPAIPKVTEVDAGHIRAVAYVPVQEITALEAYDQAEVELDDIDLVTVEGRFDVAELYRRFGASFAGVDVLKEDWRDSELAKPIFAAVQLERQELDDDGTWGLWRAVPRSRLDVDTGFFEVYERVEDLPLGGLDLRMILFDDDRVAATLLQPESYQIASVPEQWFPPSYHARFTDLQEKMEWEKRRHERQKDRGRDYVASVALGRDTRSRGRQVGMDRLIRRDPDTVIQSYAGGEVGAMKARWEGTTAAVYYDFAKEMIVPGEDLSLRDVPLLFWALDDTVEPGRTYRYRIRLGVFNPLAGTDQIVDEDMAQKKQVILWSPYSKVSGPVEIRKREYLFAQSAQPRLGMATVEVARYVLGRWHSRVFRVRLGEEIGKVVESEKDDRAKNRARIEMAAASGGTSGFATVRGDIASSPDSRSIPETADYRTGKVLIDLVPVNDRGPGPDLRQRKYYDMLYTSDGTHIERTPVDAANWPEDLMAAYRLLQKNTRKKPQPLRAFDASGTWN
ncbi:MAG: hypothetical protein KBE65_06855 [Phycisphaerae bacterium]|nr:hypothetical protein [Phycisphaerae bacterium]